MRRHDTPGDFVFASRWCLSSVLGIRGRSGNVSGNASRRWTKSARKAGQAAYNATHDAAEEAKHAAKQLGHDLQRPGQAKKGWEDAKHEHEQHPDKKQP